MNAMTKIVQVSGGARRSTPPEVEAEVIRLYLAGEKRDEIIEKAMVCKTTIDAILKRNGIALRNKRGEVTAENEAEVVRLYTAGAERKVITAQTGIPSSTITHILKRNGVERNHVRQAKLVPNARADEIVRLFLEGKSYTQIAAEIGVTPGTISGIIYRRKAKRDPSIRAANLKRSAALRAPRPKAVALAPKPKLVAVASSDDTRVLMVPEAEAAKFAAREAEPVILTAADDPVVKLRALDCRWPIGEVGTRGFRFCCAVKLGKDPYCPEHQRKAFRPLTKSEKDSISIGRWK